MGEGGIHNFSIRCSTSVLKPPFAFSCCTKATSSTVVVEVRISIFPWSRGKKQSFHVGSEIAESRQDLLARRVARM